MRAALCDDMCECSVKSVCEQSALQLLLDEPPLFSQDTGGAKIKRVKYGFIRALVRIHSILCIIPLRSQKIKVQEFCRDPNI